MNAPIWKKIEKKGLLWVYFTTNVCTCPPIKKIFQRVETIKESQANMCHILYYQTINQRNDDAIEIRQVLYVLQLNFWECVKILHEKAEILISPSPLLLSILPLYFERDDSFANYCRQRENRIWLKNVCSKKHKHAFKNIYIY